MRLAETVEGEGETLVIAHGLFGSARNWGVLTRRLADTRQVVAVDMRNHAASGWDADHGYPALAADLAETIEAHGAPADLLGHSMGGKAAMALALTRPGLVRRLVVADIAPVAYEHTQAHLIDAMRKVDLADVSRRSDADAQLASEVETPGVRAFLLQSLDVAERCWRLNLDVLEAEMPRILDWPEIDGRYDGPALFLHGALSDYVRPEHESHIRALFPDARFEAIEGAGHWLHAEKPPEVEAAIRRFLA